jgi:hypothetical protein
VRAEVEEAVVAAFADVFSVRPIWAAGGEILAGARIGAEVGILGP